MANVNDNILLSDAVNSLKDEHKSRYLDKLSIIGTSDPYLLPKAMFVPLMSVSDAESLPRMEYPDIYNYLVSTTSVYTHQELKAYKSLEGYKYFVAGWVKEVLVYKTNNSVFVILGKVIHSQRLCETPLSACVAANPDGTILFAHCTCMAGLVECCSHVAATLFAVESGVRIMKGITCTSVACSWLAPPANQNVDYRRIHDIDFTSPELKRRRIFRSESPSNTSTSRNRINSRLYVDNTEFYKKLYEAGGKSAALSVHPNYYKDFIPKTVSAELPRPLLSVLRDSAYECLTLEEIQLLVDIQDVPKVTSSQIQAVEVATRKQSASNSWFLHRAGRVTASLFKSASRTNPENPSKSLIKRICYPEAYKFSTVATKWGCTHESKASSDYSRINSSNHQDLCVKDCGFFIHEDYPFIGASPDGVVSCKCCGGGIIEIKCPFCHKNSTIEETADDRKSCLVNVNGAIQLDTNHAYYYQVQCQLAVTKRSYCDFCLWTGKELFSQRIRLNPQFFQDSMVNVMSFYMKGVLPELIGKAYTRSIALPSSNSSADAEVCFCKKNDQDKTIIQCSAENCVVKLYHKECLGLVNKPRKGWKCVNCRLIAKREKMAAVNE